jgi:hypothetical protein
MSDYKPAFERAESATELAALARTVHADDVDRGYITVLGEMVSGGVTDPVLGAEVAARIEPWIEMVEQKIDQLLEGTLFAALASSRDLAFGLVAAYFGVDMLSHLQGEQTRAESLLELAARLSALADAFLPAQREKTQ